MSKKKIITGVVVVLLVVATIQLNIIDTLFIFLMVGSLPGIAWSIPPVAMFALLAVGVIALTYFTASRQLYPGSPRMRQHRDKTLRQAARKNIARTKRRSTTRATAKRRDVSVAKAS